MSISKLRNEFQKVFAATPQPETREQTKNADHSPKPKRPSPLSLRLTHDERAQLEKEAAGLSLSAYVRRRLFDSKAAPRRTRGKAPVKDHKALARVLSALGQSELATSVGKIADAADRGSLRPSSTQRRDLERACAAIADIRRDLIQALGLQPK